MACGARVPSVVLGVVTGGHERAGDEKGQEAKGGQGRAQEEDALAETGAGNQWGQTARDSIFTRICGAHFEQRVLEHAAVAR